MFGFFRFLYSVSFVLRVFLSLGVPSIVQRHTCSGFQLSPDFRQRASSNASSVGRLSPIPSVLGIEPDWFDPREDFMATALNDPTNATTTTTTTTASNAMSSHNNNATNPITASTSSLSGATQIDNINLENLEAVAAGEDTLDAANLCALDALASALSDDLSLRTEFLQGSVVDRWQIKGFLFGYLQILFILFHSPTRSNS